MELHVDAKIEGKYPSIQSGKSKYNITPELLDKVEIGRTYSVVTKPRNVTGKKDGKTYTFQDIVAVLGEAEEHTGDTATNGNGKEHNIRENMDIKNKAIARISALNNATAMVSAYASLLVSVPMTKEEIKMYLLALKASELKENYALLGLGEEAPF